MKQRNLAKHFWECITSKYFQFSGRASRPEFWGFILFNILLGAAVGLVNDQFYSFGINITTMISTLVDLFFIVPSISVGVRRFHDTDKTGWVPVFFGIITSLSTISTLSYRLFDINLRGFNFSQTFFSSTIWFGFFAIVIVLLALYYLYVAAQRGDIGRNKYGPDSLNPELGNEIDLIGEE